MKLLTIATALLATLPLAAAEKNSPKDPKKGDKAPKVEQKDAPRQGKPDAGRKKPAGKPDPASNEKGLHALDEKELERLLDRYRTERKDVVAKVNDSHDALEGLQKEIKAKTSHLNNLQAELTKTASAIEHLKKKSGAVEKAHEDGHAKEEMLQARIHDLEKELERRKQIAALEKQAAELSRKAEALRKKAAELKN